MESINNKICKYGLIIFVLAIAMPVRGQGTEIQIVPADTSTTINDTLEIFVSIVNGDSVGAFEFELQYGTQIVTVDSVTMGSFLSSAGGTVVPIGPIWNRLGNLTVVRFAGYSLGGGVGATGDGVLAVLKIRALGIGQSPLDILNAVVTDTEGDQQNLQNVIDGTITVLASEADIDLSAVTADPDTIPADSLSTSLITVIPRDSLGNVLPQGQGVELQTTAGWLQGIIASHENGSYTQRLLSTPTPDTAFVTAIVNGDTIRQRARVVFSQRPDLIVRVAPADTNVYLGNRFDLSVCIDSVWDLGSFEFSLCYATDVVKVDSVWLGAFLGESGRDVGALNPVIDNASNTGSVSFGGYSLGSDSGPSGSGVLAHLRLIPILLGQTVMDLRDAVVTNTDGRALDINLLMDGLITVIPSAVDVDLAMITADPDTIPADSLSTSLITVIPRDSLGNVLPQGQGVELQTTAGWLQGVVASHENGSYTQRLLSTPTPDTAFVTAIVNGDTIRQRAQVVFLRRPDLIVRVAPADTVVFKENVFNMRICLENCWDLGGFEAALQFPKSILRFEDVRLGSFLSSTGRNVGMVDTLVNFSNDFPTLRIGGYSFGNQPGPSGSGEAVIIRFKADSAGIANLILSDIRIVNAAGQPQFVDSLSHGRVTVIIGEVDPDSTIVFAEPDTIPADGINTSRITIIPRDPNGFRLGPGQSINLQITIGHTLGAVVDHGDGTYTQHISSITPGSAQITAVVNNVSINQKPVVIFTELAKIFLTTPSDTNIAGESFWVTLHVGSSRCPVYGLANIQLVIEYSDISTISQADSICRGTFFGDTSLVNFDFDTTSPGSISINTGTKSGGSAPNDHGIITELKFTSNPYTKDSTVVSFSIHSVAGVDSNSNPINLSSDSLSVTIRGLLVWPGDTNNDGIVNNIDILPIGLCNSDSGATRRDATSNWVGQFCTRWIPEAATYADANGNGIVTRDDVSVIYSNWFKKHNLVIPRSKVFQESICKGLLRPVVRENDDDRLVLDLEIEDIQDMGGIAFELHYPSNWINIISVTPGSFFGNESVSLVKIEPQSGVVAVGLTKLKQNTKGQGSNCVATLVMELPVSDNRTIKLKFSRVTFLTTRGEWFTIYTEPWIFEGTINSIPTKFVLHQNYPNPFNPATTLRYEIPVSSHVEVTVYDLLGSAVVTLINEAHEAGFYEIIWDGKNQLGELVSSGIYYFRIKAGEFLRVRKGLLLK